MDKSFEIENREGDLIRIALSCYDAETVGLFTTDPIALSVVFYDVTLIREKGSGRIGYQALHMVSATLADFLYETPDAVLCFYCDDQTEVDRRNLNLTPQEYRSNLFSKMYDRYIEAHGINWLINYKIRVEVDKRPRITHFICREDHAGAVATMGDVLINVKP